MATKRWIPKALAVAQVDTVQVTAYDAATTYTLTVNGLDLVSVAGNTSANQTAADINTAWNAVTHAYAAGITSTVATDTVTLTADTAEVPFTVSSSVTGGNGTIGNVTNVTAATGPHTVTDVDNWGGALPSANDTIVLADTAISMVWALGSLSTGNHTLIVEQSFTGSIGLNKDAFARDADGGNTTTTAPEYRPVYLTLDVARLEVGGHSGPGNPAGSQRLLIDNDRAGASQTVIYRTGASGSETGKPPTRLKFAHASADVDVRGGQVGIAVDAGDETSTVGDIVVNAGQCFVGSGVTLTNYTQNAGVGGLDLGAATVTKAELFGGELAITGNQVVTTLDVYGGNCACATTGNVTTANARGGTLDLTVSAEARNVPTLNLYRGATVRYDKDVVTVTTLALAEAGNTRLTLS